MRARDILVLGLLVLLVVALTIVEKYGEHRRDDQRRQEAAIERLQWENRISDALDSRWKELSAGLRRSLDSLARATVAAGVNADSLVAVLGDTPVRDSAPATARGSVSSRAMIASRPDTLASTVAREYRAALASLPTDLNSYERRVAANEVGALIRAKFGLTVPGLDSVLSQLPE
ncbi:MAG: hypothetical protein AB1792_09915 [Candidatus Zixiibacteriota bacterium]